MRVYRGARLLTGAEPARGAPRARKVGRRNVPTKAEQRNAELARRIASGELTPGRNVGRSGPRMGKEQARSG